MNIVSMYHDPCGNIVESNLLAKVTKIEYAQYIQSGKLYMNNLSFFRKLEQDGVGDEQEGLIASGQIGVGYYNGQKLFDIKNLKTYVDGPVFCAMSIPLLKSTDSEAKFKIPQQLLREFMSDKDAQYALLVIDKEKFQERIKNTIDAQGLCGYYGMVHYTDDQSPVDLYHAALRKRIKYSYQHEWRLVLSCSVENGFILDIGNIEDISFCLPISSRESDIEIGVNYNA